MKNKKNIIILISIIILIIGFSFIFLSKKERKQNISIRNEFKNSYKQAIKNDFIDSEEISKIKEDNHITGKSDLYEINTEYDGRKVVNIKADIQYKVAFAGIIKKDIPQLNEIDKIFSDNYPNKKGIWIEQHSREKVIKLIEQNTKSKYKITEDGYLLIENKDEQNENDRNLEKLINMNNTIIITINDSYYEVDTITGEIVEYPFEKLDSYQSYDYVKLNDDIIVIVTSNTKSDLDDKEIIEDILNIEIERGGK